MQNIDENLSSLIILLAIIGLWPIASFLSFILFPEPAEEE